jgi:uroporphyrinogen-III synthase
MALAEPPGWYVISLRPHGQHAALRRAAATHGARVIALSPWRLAFADDAQARAALVQALQASRVVVTSPAAVRAAQALQPLRAAPGQRWIAVGSGTAAALRRAGVAEVATPARMDSEGLLALPALDRLHGADVGLVSAPGGRELLSATLIARGARLRRADVYRRAPCALAPRSVQRLRTLERPAWIALSSAQALSRVLEVLPDDVRGRFLRWPAMAASARLRQMALDAGLARVEVAEGPRPAQMVAAIASRFR